LQTKKTVKACTPCEVEIIDIGSTGEGIGRVDGLAVFVDGGVPGDVVKARIDRIKRNYARGSLLEVLKPSPDRHEGFCVYGGICGGCRLQHVDYGAQLKYKEKWVRDCLVRIGGVGDPLVYPVLGMDKPVRYRNKAVFTVGRVRGKEKKIRGCDIGFFKAGSGEVVNCDTCMIQTEAAEKVAEVLRGYIKRNKVPVYDHESGTGVIRNVIVKTAFGTGEVMVILVATHGQLPEMELLVTDLDRAVGELPDLFLESVILNVNRNKRGEVLGKDWLTVAGKTTIKDIVCGLNLEISPQSFYQVNPVQMERLYEKVAEFADLTGSETVFDLYCGVGTIGLYLAKKAQKVIGIEAVEDAILDANRNAVLNGIVNVEYICGRAEEEMAKLMEEGKGGLKADVVVIDPPRAGCDPQLLKLISHTLPQRVVYVSCDPATMARDVKILCAGGYDFIKAQPVDMFPHTGSTETVALLKRR
jgi:23S rRNA (uracil1939-C5)-methyltransferase